MLGALATLGAGFLNAAGSVYSNTLNSATQLAVNDQNARLQYQINADQIEAARMNNETAINLANTAHQREVMDLRDANLNPILSANGNGSAVPALDTPGLEAPTMEAPTITNPLAGLASQLASAVQVNDAHQLNEARLGVLGMKGEKNSRYQTATPQTINNLNSAKVQDALLLERERIELERDKIANDRLLEGLRSHAIYTYTQGSDHDVNEAQKLAREGLLSDLKMRANQNFRAGISSAKDVADAAGNVGSLFIKKGKK